MNTIIFFITIVYFIIGIAVVIFSVYPAGTWFSKLCTTKFKSATDFNNFMLWVWLYPVVFSFILQWFFELYKSM